MGNNNLFALTPGSIAIVDHVDQYLTAFGGDIVPRDASGVVTNAAGDLGSATAKFKNLNLSGTANITILKANDFQQTLNLSQNPLLKLKKLNFVQVGGGSGIERTISYTNAEREINRYYASPIYDTGISPDISIKEAGIY